MSTKEIQIFSTSFLDLLSCGMAAIIVLCFIFAARKSGEGDMKGDGLVVAIKSPANLVLRVKHKTGEAVVGMGNADSIPFLITPWVHGAKEYKLVIDERAVDAREQIEIFWCDYDPILTDATAYAEVSITIFANNRRDKNGLRLSHASPVVAVPVSAFIK